MIQKGETALMWASENCDSSVLQVLLLAGADVNVQTKVY